MTATTREAFLARVARAVRAGNKHRETTRQELPESVGYLGAGADPLGRLVEELTKVGASAIRVHTRDEVSAAMRSLVTRCSITRAVLNNADILVELGVGELLRSLGVEVVTASDLASLDEPARRDRLFAVDLGVA